MFTSLIVKMHRSPSRGAAQIAAAVPGSTVLYRARSSSRTRSHFTVHAPLSHADALRVLSATPGVYEIREVIAR
jgi:hypothetical protein